MKKVLPVIISVCLLAGIVAGYMYVMHKRHVTDAILKRAMSTNQSFRIKLPDGKMAIVLTGIIVMENDGHRTNAVLHMPITGHEYLLFNAPFVYSLRLKAVGKMVSLRGRASGVSDFKHLPVFWIDDVLEIKEVPPAPKIDAKAAPKKSPAKGVKKKATK